MDPSTLVSEKNAALAAAIVTVLAFARGAAPALFLKRPVQRVLPTLPILMGITSIFAGFGEGGTTWQDRLVSGILTGAAASALYKIGRTSLLGQGLDPSPSDPPPAPAAVVVAVEKP